MGAGMSQRSCRDGATMGKVLLEEALGGRARRREKSIKSREREQRSHFLPWENK